MICGKVYPDEMKITQMQRITFILVLKPTDSCHATRVLPGGYCRNRFSQVSWVLFGLRCADNKRSDFFRHRWSTFSLCGGSKYAYSQYGLCGTSLMGRYQKKAGEISVVIWVTYWMTFLSYLTHTSPLYAGNLLKRAFWWDSRWDFQIHIELKSCPESF